jgi:hypothetical protein
LTYLTFVWNESRVIQLRNFKLFRQIVFIEKKHASKKLLSTFFPQICFFHRFFLIASQWAGGKFMFMTILGKHRTNLTLFLSFPLSLHVCSFKIDHLTSISLKISSLCHMNTVLLLNTFINITILKHIDGINFKNPYVAHRT